jgi:Zn-dependent protease with chaperone function
MNRSVTLWMPSRIVDVVDAARKLGLYPFAIRLIIVLAAVVCWWVAGALGGFDSTWTLAILVFAAAAAVSPDGLAPAGLIIVMVGDWVAGVDPVSFGWLFVPALSALVVHVAAARAATTVPGAPLDPASVLLWLRQVAVVAAATLMMWLIVLRLSESPGPEAMIVGIVAFGLVAATSIAFTCWSATPAEDDD